jgi:FRG domain
MTDHMTIASVNELIQLVDATFKSTKTRWWFRGQRDFSWNLLPKVRRGYTRQQERYLTNLFYTRAQTRHAVCPAADDYAGWLAMMQHFGLPTRLLDWTISPEKMAVRHALQG